jgi:hypothetical protein
VARFRRRQLVLAVVVIAGGLVSASVASSSPATASAFSGRLMRPADRPGLVFRRFSRPVVTSGPVPAIESARRSFEVGSRATSLFVGVKVWIRRFSSPHESWLYFLRYRRRASGTRSDVRATRVGHGLPAWSVRATRCGGTCTARLEWSNGGVNASVLATYPTETRQWSQVRKLLQRLADIQDARIIGVPPGGPQTALGSCVPATPGACGSPPQLPPQPVNPRPWA